MSSGQIICGLALRNGSSAILGTRKQRFPWFRQMLMQARLDQAEVLLRANERRSKELLENPDDTARVQAQGSV